MRRFIVVAWMIVSVAGCTSVEEQAAEVYAVPRVSGDPTWQTGPWDQVSLTGRVADATRISPHGEPFDHMLVTLRLDDGREQLIDLGPIGELSDLYLGRGSTIDVVGQMGAAHGGQWLLVAQRINSGGQWRNVSGSADHPAPPAPSLFVDDDY